MYTAPVDALAARADAFLTSVARFTYAPVTYGALAGAITKPDEVLDQRAIGHVLDRMVELNLQPWSALLAAYVVRHDDGEPGSGYTPHTPGASALTERRAAFRMVDNHYRVLRGALPISA